MEGIVKKYDYRELIKKAKNYYDEKMDYEIKKDKKSREDRYLQLSYFIYYPNNKYVSIEERLYIHNGIRCQKCYVYPIQGHRYYCPICPIYNLCALCEKDEKDPHEHGLIKIRKNEDLDKLSNKYKFEIEISNMSKDFEIKANKNNNYNINIKNTGKEPWPKDTVITYIKEFSDCGMAEGVIGKIEPGNKKSFQLKLRNVNFQKINVHSIVLTLKAKLRNNEEIKFLFPVELHFFNEI